MAAEQSLPHSVDALDACWCVLPCPGLALSSPSLPLSSFGRFLRCTAAVIKCIAVHLASAGGTAWHVEAPPHRRPSEPGIATEVSVVGVGLPTQLVLVWWLRQHAGSAVALQHHALAILSVCI